MQKTLLLFLIVLLEYHSQASVGFTVPFDNFTNSSYSSLSPCDSLNAIVLQPAVTSACEGDSIQLLAMHSPNVYSQWFKDGVAFGLPNAQSIYATQSGVYHLEVTSTLLQCSFASNAIAIIIHPLPVVYAGEDVAVCEGAYVEFIASGALTYVWSNGVSDTYGMLVYESGGVSVIGTDAFGCSNSDTLVLNVTQSQLFFPDFDGDGYALNYGGFFACNQPQGYLSGQGNDCNDYSASVHPGVNEVCNNMDDDCNSLVDDGLAFATYYRDMDGDSFGSDIQTLFSCQQPIGYVLVGGDCMDNHPQVHPGAAEWCNDRDDDCDGAIDNGWVLVDYFPDGDGDSFGDLNLGFSSCSNPGNSFVLIGGDCDDTNSSVSPGALESCNSIDDNCDGTIDNNVLYVVYYADADGDGFGNAATAVSYCSPPGVLFVTSVGDCDDTNAQINLGVLETCNGIDDNCDGAVDNGLLFTNYYLDFDGDGFGNMNNVNSLCSNPGSLFVVDSSDCNDSNFEINPSVSESCNNIDDNCDGAIDNGLVFSIYYVDSDGDLFGDPNNSSSFCAAPMGNFVGNNADCDDTNAQINPGTSEILENGMDDDCNPATADVSVQELMPVDFTLYPNPAENELTIYSSNNNSGVVFIYNSIGMLISSINLFGSTMVLDISEWSAGRYIVRIGNLNKTIVKL